MIIDSKDRIINYAEINDLVDQDILQVTFVDQQDFSF